ncbi:P-loop containing nucleoside triphosphate hydrolases superfamily protein [Fagus crenata]
MAMALWKVALSELSELFSHLASLFFMWGTFKQFLPRTCIDSFWNKLIAYFKPETSITFYEKVSGRQGDYKRNEAYTAVENYLTTISTHQSKNLKAEFNKKKKSAKLSMDENEEAWDEFDGIKVKWFSGKYVSQSRTISYYPSDTEKRFYVLTFNTKYLKSVTENYLDYVVSEGRAIQFKRKQKRKNKKGKGGYKNPIAKKLEEDEEDNGGGESKVLAKNYLDIESHPLFEKISQLLEEVNMSPADVAENLMPKIEGGKAETCLESLIQALESLKEGEAQDKENRKEETEISLCESDAEETKSEVNSDSSKEDDNSSS